MKFYTYILQGEKGWYYVGSTNNIKRRLKEHKIGNGGYFTHHKFKGILLLKYFEAFNTRVEAEARTKRIEGFEYIINSDKI